MVFGMYVITRAEARVHLGVAVDTRDVETGLEQLNRVESRTGRRIEDFSFHGRSMSMKNRPSLSARSPIDQFVPLSTND